jgi:hypothetical protein
MDSLFYFVRNYIGQLIGGGIGIISIPIAIWLLYKFLVQRKAQEYDIPALDKFDAIKLDAMVSQRVEAALKPMLQSNGYSEEEVKSILTKNSLKNPTFRR